MTQKVLRVGTSAAVTIPKRSLEELGLKIGDHVRVEVDKKQQAFVIQPAVKVDAELTEWTKQFINQYKVALDALAK